MGNGVPDKAREYGKVCRRIGLCISAVLAVVCFVGGETLYRLFFEEIEP